MSILIVNIDIPLACFWSWWALPGDLSNLTWSQNQYSGPKWDESIAGVSAISIFIYYWNFTFFRKNINRPIIPMGNISPLDFDWSCCILKFVMLNSCPLKSDWSCWYLGSSPGSVYMSRVLRVAPGMPANIDYWLLARYHQPIYIGVIWIGSCDSPNIFYHWKVTAVVATVLYYYWQYCHCSWHLACQPILTTDYWPATTNPYIYWCHLDRVLRQSQYIWPLESDCQYCIIIGGHSINLDPHPV